jgi:hypothetical protein
MHSNPHAERQGTLALGEVAVAEAVGAVGGDAEAGVESVEGAFGVALGVAVAEFAGQVGVVDLVQGGQVAAELAGELVDRPAGKDVSA